MALTLKQRELVALAKKTDNLCAVGGARSGKTYGILMYIFYVALKYPKTRFLIARQYSTDIRASIWAITLPQVLQDLDLHDGTDFNRTEHMIMTLSNKSVIICSGLDDKERVDKILGQEYTLIYVNECHDIPWTAVDKLMTRLSQNEGARNQFFCDLNPVGIIHWAYKLFVLKKHPVTGEPIGDDYQAIEINPYDNLENLPKDYIAKRLETLTGSARTRFLEGKWAVNDDLKVFSPPKLYQWKDFETWAYAKDKDLRLVGGLDLGFQDADAFCVLAYYPGDKETWLLWEHKTRRDNIEQLAQKLKAGILWVEENVPCRNKSFDIWADTATLHHGKEGDTKKSARDLHDRFNLPVRPAHKREKRLGIEFLQDDVNNGRFKIFKGSPFADETEQTVWTRYPDGTIVHEIDDDTYHPDMMDAIIYAMRYIYIDNEAFQDRGKEKEEKKTSSEVTKYKPLLKGRSRFW